MIACRIRVTGLVQGVGFRPHVWRLATEMGVRGWVRNDSLGVEIAAEGGRLADFLDRLKREAPPLARVDSVVATDAAPGGFADFSITESQPSRDASPVNTGVGFDTAVCPDCLAEMFDPNGRRFRHAFITCTHCGPRYTVTRALPYDRPQTSLAPFPLCPDCEREYRDPADRRFHAETTCCPVCGPKLRLRDAHGNPIVGEPVAAALQLLKSGAIVAIKGLGGFHLACDASNAEAVATLRERKAREEKPFAVMVANVESLRRYATPDEEEISLLESRERPVVLVSKRAGADELLRGVSPRLTFLGAMLPYTPLQHLFFHDAPDLALVMTSANPGGEPLVIGNDEALQRLSGISDAILDHDREILIRCDDSVRTATQLIRRARGYTPRPIKLEKSGPSILASVLSLGGWFKNTICLTRGNEAFVSQHIGDLDNAATIGFLEETVAHLTGILEVEPALVVHDLHPDFASTRLAVSFAAAHGIPALAVQHHHAHIAAVLAEHHHVGPVLGLALDGVGLGSDGQAWGGELLRVEGAGFVRLGHLEEIALPGGDRAAREPWRMGAAVLHRLGRGREIETRYADQPGAATIRQMLERGTNCPATSSCGRWFDAAAGLLGIRPVMAFEAQAAMLLEGLAAAHGRATPLAGGWTLTADGGLSLIPLMEALADMGEGGDVARGAALFQDTLAAAMAEWVSAAVEREKIASVALGGGCFLNRLLAQELRRRLVAAGVKVLEARQVPPNDGGLSLGQAWIALQK
jgi:hydrogenase maturation protein HypF